MTLGQRLYDMRKAKGLSQEKVAEILGVTRQTVSKWETDQTTPDFDKIVPLCTLYGINTQELLTGEKDSSTDSLNNKMDSCGYYQSGSENSNSTFGSYYTDTEKQAQPNYTEHTENTQLAASQKKRFALLLSFAIFLYILSPVPFFFSGEIGPRISLVLFFIIIAAATMIIVFAAVSKIKIKKKLINNKEMSKEEKLYKQIIEILTLITLVVYLLVSFTTMAWGITWILWVVNALAGQVVKLIFSMKGVDVDETK